MDDDDHDNGDTWFTVSLGFDLGSSCFPVFVSVELIVVYVILSSLLIHRLLIVVCKKIEYNTNTHIGVYRKKKSCRNSIIC